MSPGKVVGPAVFINRFGKGKAVLVAASPDTAYIQRYRMAEHRNLIRNLVRYLNPNPEVLVQAPASVEIMIARDAPKKRLLVHLVSYSAPPTATSAAFDKGRQVLPPVMEEAAEYVAHIEANRPFTKAVAAGGDTRIGVRNHRLTVATASIHEVITIQQ